LPTFRREREIVWPATAFTRQVYLGTEEDPWGWRTNGGSPRPRTSHSITVSWVGRTLIVDQADAGRLYVRSTSDLLPIDAQHLAVAQRLVRLTRRAMCVDEPMS